MNPNASNQAKSHFQNALMKIDRETDPVMSNVVSGLVSLVEAVQGIEQELAALKNR